MAVKKSARAGAGEKRKRISSQQGNRPRDQNQVRNKFLTAAIEAFDLGLRPIPVDTDKKALIKWRDYQSNRPTLAEVEAWPWDKAAGVAILTGVGGGFPGIDAIDFDPGHAPWPPDGRELPTDCIVKTPRDGFHCYTLHVKGARNSAGALAPGVDVRAQGGYVLIPPSPGYYYEFGSLADAVKAGPPERWLAEALLNPKGAKVTKAPAVTPATPAPREATAATVRALIRNMERLRRAPPGAQNDTLNETAYKLRGAVYRGELDRAEVVNALLKVADEIGYFTRPGNSKRGAVATINSGLDAEIDDLELRSVNCSDTGNAEYFERLYEGQVKYDYRRARWLIKDTHFWAEDKTERVRELAVAAIRTMHRDAVNLDDADLKKKITAHAIKSENEPQLRRLLECARSKPGIRDAGIGWDAKPELLGTPLGVVDLRTGRLRDANADDKITRVVEHYDPTATAPRWERFLTEVFPPNKEFQEYIQMAVGYCLTGYTCEKVFFFCYGPTNSGKTTYLEALLTAFGEYGDTAPFEIFVAGKYGKGEGASPFLVTMADRRFIKSAEPPTRRGRAGVTFDEGMIKELTGRDTIKVRDLWGKPFSVKVQYHIWFSANDRPEIRAEAEPIWARVKPIPFGNTFDGDAADISLDEKLAAENAGILNYAIRGAVMWWEASKGGTRPALQDVPSEIKEANAEWRTDNDLFAAFLKDEVSANEGGEVSNERLYKAYRGWWAREGLNEGDGRFLSSSAMGRRLAKAGYERGKTTKGARCWRGIDLKSLYDNREPDPLPEDEAAEF